MQVRSKYEGIDEKPFGRVGCKYEASIKKLMKNLLGGSVAFIHRLSFFHLIGPAGPNLNLIKIRINTQY